MAKGIDIEGFSHPIEGTDNTVIISARNPVIIGPSEKDYNCLLSVNIDMVVINTTTNARLHTESKIYYFFIPKGSIWSVLDIYALALSAEVDKNNKLPVVTKLTLDLFRNEVKIQTYYPLP